MRTSIGGPRTATAEPGVIAIELLGCCVTLLIAGVSLTGCSASAPPPLRHELEETRVVAHTSGDEIVTESYDAGQLFERAYTASQRGDCEAATPLYGQIVDEFPSSRFAPLSLYNAALCLQRLGRYSESASRYEALIEAFPTSNDIKPAMFQLALVLHELERWDDLRGRAETLLERDDLRSHERLEAMTRRAQGLLGAGQVDAAERASRDALTYYRTRRGDEVIHDDYFAAAANFVMAESLRLRSEALSFPEAEVSEQHAVLDQRSQLLLEAQRAYFDTMRFHDARWAAAAGYRIGSMYERFFQDITAAPVPPPGQPFEGAALESYRASYRQQLRDRVKPLMRHAINYWELTLMMAERTGLESVEPEWVRRTRADLERVRATLIEEDTLPEATLSFPPDDVARSSH